jgi:hypothetical protein
MTNRKRCPIAYAGNATVTVSGMFAYCGEDDCAWWTGSRCGVLRPEPVCAETPPYAMYHAPKLPCEGCVYEDARSTKSEDALQCMVCTRADRHWHWVKTDRYTTG